MSKKIKHLVDCTEDHLKNIGMKELENSSSILQRTILQITKMKKKGSQEKKVQVPLPSNAFGHSVVDKKVSQNCQKNMGIITMKTLKTLNRKQATRSVENAVSCKP